MKVGEIISILAEAIPPSFQESYDNSGLQVGNVDSEVDSILLTLDVTQDVVEEAIGKGIGMIVSHHPLIFSGLMRLSGEDVTQRTVIKALSGNISVYSAHTNLDVIPGGVSYRMADKIGLQSVKPLQPVEGKLAKLVVYVPEKHAGEVRNAMFEAGAGHIGNYDRCSFNLRGEGTFRAGTSARPYSGTPGNDHSEEEIRVETVVPDHLLGKVINALLVAHPYEEVAYDIYRMLNALPGAGLGCIGQLGKPEDEHEFLERLSGIFAAGGIRYSPLRGKKISRVAVCGGSGGSLVGRAMAQKADIFITGDVKYHSFFEPDRSMVIADIGHYESEKFALEILYEIITKKLPKFAVRFSEIDTNPVNYLRSWKKQR